MHQKYISTLIVNFYNLHMYFYISFIDYKTCLEHHVHFSGGSGLGKDNSIMIQPQRHGQIDAHLGFLQLYHRSHIFLANK